MAGMEGCQRLPEEVKSKCTSTVGQFLWGKATYSLPMRLYMPMPTVMEVILDLASKRSAVCIQPTTFLRSTHFRFGQNKKH